MTDRQDELGRILSTLLKEETEAMQVDINSGAERLEREITQSDRRRRSTVAAAGIAAAAVVIGLVLWRQSDNPPDPVPSDGGSDSDAAGAPYFLDLSTGETTPLPEALLPDGTPGLYASDYAPDGTQVALKCVPGATCEGHGRLEVGRADGTVIGVPIPDEHQATILSWSGDGTKLLYRLYRGEIGEIGGIGDLHVYDLAQGTGGKVAELGPDDAYWVDVRADFSPDGETVVFHRPRDASSASKLDLWTVPATGGEPTLVRRHAAQPRYLGDGRIAFVQPGSNSLVGRVIAAADAGDPQNSAPRTLVELPENVVDWYPSPDSTRALVSLDEGLGLVEIATGRLADLADVGGSWAGNDRLIVEPPDH